MGLEKEKEPVSLLFIQQTLNAQLMPGAFSVLEKQPRKGRIPYLKGLTYSLEEEDQQVSKTDWEGWRPWEKQDRII